MSQTHPFRNLPPDISNSILYYITDLELPNICLVDHCSKNYITNYPIWKQIATDHNLILKEENQNNSNINYKEIVMHCLWFVKKYKVNPRIFKTPIVLDKNELYLDNHSFCTVTKMNNGDFSSQLRDTRTGRILDLSTYRELCTFIKLGVNKIIIDKSYYINKHPNMPNIPVIDVARTIVNLSKTKPHFSMYVEK